jgi:hypothetical protein
VASKLSTAIYVNDRYECAINERKDQVEKEYVFKIHVGYFKLKGIFLSIFRTATKNIISFPE